jgi:hypothetical protein
MRNLTLGGRVIQARPQELDCVLHHIRWDLGKVNEEEYHLCDSQS